MGAERNLASARRAATLQRIAARHPARFGQGSVQRLRELEQRGVISRHIQPTSPPSVHYALTPLGQEMVPALDAIVAVGHKLKAAG